MPSPDLDVATAYPEIDQAFDEWVEFLARDDHPDRPEGSEYSRSLAEQIRAKPMVRVLIIEAFAAGYWSGYAALKVEQMKHG